MVDYRAVFPFMAQSILRRSIKRGLHIYERYTIKTIPTYTEKVVSDVNDGYYYIEDDSVMYIPSFYFYANSYSYDKITNDYVINSFQEEDIDDVIWDIYKNGNAKGYFFVAVSSSYWNAYWRDYTEVYDMPKPSSPYHTKYIAKLKRVAHAGVGENKRIMLYADIMYMDQSGTTQTCGDFYDRIVTGIRYPENGIFGDYWYKLII